MQKIDLENHFYTQSLIDAFAERKEPPYRTPDNEIFWTDTISMKQGKFLPLLLDMAQGRKKLMDEQGITLAAPTLGFTMDTITTTIKLLASGLLDELPDLKIVLGHLGESIPFLLERMDNRLFAIPNSYIRCQHKLKYYFENNIWVTTSGNMSKDAFVCTQNVLGMDKICFATDYPYEDVPEMMEFLDGIPLTQKDREEMYYKTAVEQLGIPL